VRNLKRTSDKVLAKSKTNETNFEKYLGLTQKIPKREKFNSCLKFALIKLFEHPIDGLLINFPFFHFFRCIKVL